MSSTTCIKTSLPIINPVRTSKVLIGIVFLILYYFPLISVNAQQVSEGTYSPAAGDYVESVSQLADVSNYSLVDIMETLFTERLQTGDYTLRRACMERFEDLIYDYPPINPDAERTYHTMVFKAIMEIKHTTVTQGAVVWQIQNHGFVVKTPSITLGFDLYDYYNYPEFSELADLLDVYFISHGHRDHFSELLINAMSALGKPVVGPAELPDDPKFENVSIHMNADDVLTINGCTVTAHDGGDHAVPVRMYEVVTPDGLKLMHTGDKEYTNTLPTVSDIDILMFTSWISIPTSERTDSTRIEGIITTVNFYQPGVAIAGHLIELGHLQYISPTQPAWPLYHNAYSAGDSSLLSEYRIPAWGERYQYGGTIDNILPNPVENLTYQMQQDTVILSWDPPLPAADNETATYYRVIADDTYDYWVDDTEFHHFADPSFNFKVYAYDSCGNQSEQYQEITGPAVSVDELYKKSIPQAYQLAQNFPNPFNSVTTIHYQIPTSSFVTLSVYNDLGQLVAVLVNENKNSGYHSIVWDANDMSPGLYFYRISAGEYSAVKKCFLLK